MTAHDLNVALTDLATRCYADKDALLKYRFCEAIARTWAAAAVTAQPTLETVSAVQKATLIKAANELASATVDDPAADQVVEQIKDSLLDKILQNNAMARTVADRMIGILGIITDGVDPGPMSEEQIAELDAETPKEAQQDLLATQFNIKALQKALAGAPSAERKAATLKTLEYFETRLKLLNHKLGKDAPKDTGDPKTGNPRDPGPARQDSKPDKPEKPSPPEKPERPDRPERPERPDRPEGPDRPERPSEPGPGRLPRGNLLKPRRRRRRP